MTWKNVSLKFMLLCYGFCFDAFVLNLLLVFELAGWYWYCNSCGCWRWRTKKKVWFCLLLVMYCLLIMNAWSKNIRSLLNNCYIACLMICWHAHVYGFILVYILYIWKLQILTPSDISQIFLVQDALAVDVSRHKPELLRFKPRWRSDRANASLLT